MKKMAILALFCSFFITSLCLADDYHHRDRYVSGYRSSEGVRKPVNPFRAIGEMAGTIIRAPIEITRGIGDVASGRKTMGESSYSTQESPGGMDASFRNYPHDPAGRLPHQRYGYGPAGYLQPGLGGGGTRVFVGSQGWRVQMGNR